MGQVGEDLEVGAVRGGRPLHLAGREDAVLPAADHEHRQLGDQRRLGERERQHVEVGEIRLVLEPVVIGPHLGVAHDRGEEHLACQFGGLDDRPQTHQNIGLEELQRVTECEAERRPEDAARGDRRDQDCGGGGVRLEVLLDDQPAHRMADQDRGLGERRGSLGDIGNVVRDAVPAKAPAVGGTSVTAEIDRLHEPAAVREVAEEVLLPTPRTVPGAMHEKQRWHQAPLNSTLILIQWRSNTETL